MVPDRHSCSVMVAPASGTTSPPCHRCCATSRVSSRWDQRGSWPLGSGAGPVRHARRRGPRDDTRRVRGRRLDRRRPFVGCEPRTPVRGRCIRSEPACCSTSRVPASGRRGIACTTSRPTAGARRRRTRRRPRLKQSDLVPRPRSQSIRRISWLSDFANVDGAADLIAEFDAPFDINIDANRQISAETKTWDESDLVARCRDRQPFRR